MLQLSTSFLNRPVMSLRTGSEIARVTDVILNPNNLKIEGFYCDVPQEKTSLILLTQDIRSIMAQGYAVNDHDVLTAPAELVRLRNIIGLNFQLVGKQVVTADGHKIGKVDDWAADTTTYYVQKLYVGAKILKSLSSAQLSVDRTQIVEITNKRIIIQEILKGHPAAVGVPVT